MPVKIIDKSKQFIAKAQEGSDLVLSAMGTDILRLSKQQVPISKPKSAGGRGKSSGQLQSSGLLTKLRPRGYKIVYNKEYARFQHEGGDGKRVVRRYSYPGKKSHYLIDPARQIISSARTYIKRYLAGIKV